MIYLQHHYKLIGLSNVDHYSFLSSDAKLGVKLAAAYTTADTDSYKPSARDIDKSSILQIPKVCFTTINRLRHVAWQTAEVIAVMLKKDLEQP